MSYLAYENRAYWLRANYFLVANSIILGFSLGAIANADTLAAFGLLVPLGLASLAGLAICRLWSRALEAGQFWADRWEDVLRRIEPFAFGEIQLLRGIDHPGEMRPVSTARNVARDTMYLFALVWFIVLVAVVVGATIRVVA